METVSKSFAFEYAHRLRNHAGKCVNIHGHSSTVIITVQTEDGVCGDMVVDFSDLKKVVGKWLEKRWDHAFIISEYDKDLIKWIQHFPKQKIFILPGEPTAEHMARYLSDILPDLFKKAGLPIKLVQVVFYETAGACATIS